MSTYNKKNLKNFLEKSSIIIKKYREKSTSQGNSFTSRKIKILTILCEEYINHFPDRKIYITKKLGKRVSYLTGSGNELFLKAFEIKLEDNFLLYIQSEFELTKLEKERLKTLFNTVIFNFTERQV